MPRPSIGVQPLEDLTIINAAAVIIPGLEGSSNHNIEVDIEVYHLGVDKDGQAANNTVYLVAGSDTPAESTWFFDNTAVVGDPFKLFGIPLPSKLRAITTAADGAKVRIRLIYRHRGHISR